MNYIKQINYYWQMHEFHSFNANETALYFYLLKRANVGGNGSAWRETLEIKSSAILNAMGWKDVRTINAARDKLQIAGLIQYKQHPKNAYSTYILSKSATSSTTFYAADNADDSKSSTPTTTSSSAPSDASSGALNAADEKLLLISTNKQNQTKQNGRESTCDQIILKPDDLIIRLKECEYGVKEFICHSYKFNEAQYFELVDLFVGEKSIASKELEIIYSEALAYFKRWVRSNHEKLKRRFQQPRIQSRAIHALSVNEQVKRMIENED